MQYDNYDSEIWSLIAELDGQYEVSSSGHVRSVERYGTYRMHDGREVTRKFNSKILKSDEHGNVYIRGTNYKISYLVAAAFIRPLTHTDCIRHIDGDVTNNCVSNLEVVDTSALGSDWTDIPDYDGIYQVSREGLIRRLRSRVYHPTVGELTLTTMMIAVSLDEDGYERVSLTCPDGTSKLLGVHRLVAQAFIPNPNDLPCVNHIDGNKRNNRVENLEWCTVEYNNHHAAQIGLRPKSIYRPVGESAKRRLSKAVRCINSGEIFYSMIEAERQLGLRSAAVHDAIVNNRPTTTGLSFELVNL